MAVLRIHKKQQNFVILDKTCLNDELLSWAAKGLHSYLMSLPDNWRVRVSDLRERARNGRDAVRGLLNELEKAGYIQKSICRDDASGRFGGIEYLVLEIPEPEIPVSAKNEQNSPDPENPFLVNPATENPAPVNATLINNNRISNKKLNNKTAAANKSDLSKATSIQTQPKAAAVLFSQSANHEENQRPLELLSPNDGVISDQLTQAQKQRINTLVNNLNVSQKEQLREEIEFCLLNPKHFTVCGHDFSRKLNAIRGVILRGEWQTPAGMMDKASAIQNPNNLAVKQLETELKEAYAEATHFRKLLATAKKHTRTHFEIIISQAQSKIHDIEEQIRRSLSGQQEASCG